MKQWLSEPATRAEAIGWALTMPALLCTGLMGYVLVHNIHTTTTFTRTWPDAVPPVLAVYTSLGVTGLTLLVVVCGLLPILAQLSRQPVWVRLAAPVVCGLLVAALLWSHTTLFVRFAENVTLLHGQEAAESISK